MCASDLQDTDCVRKGMRCKQEDSEGHKVQSGMDGDLEWISCRILSRCLAAVYVCVVFVYACGLRLCWCVFGGDVARSGCTPLQWSF